LPESPQRTQQELLLLIALGASLLATQGYGTPEIERDLPTGVLDFSLFIR